MLPNTILDKPLTVAFTGNTHNYAGFGIRATAGLIDFVITIPALAIYFYAVSKISITEVLIISSIPTAMYIWYHVYLVRRYGGTPGKRMLRLRIVKTDYMKAGWLQALLRYSVTLALFVTGILCFLLHVFLYYDTAMRWIDTRIIDTAFQAIALLRIAWILSEYIVLLTNKKKRSFQDYIAQTVVIREEKKQPAPIPLR